MNKCVSVCVIWYWIYLVCRSARNRSHKKPRRFDSIGRYCLHPAKVALTDHQSPLGNYLAPRLNFPHKWQHHYNTQNNDNKTMNNCVYMPAVSLIWYWVYLNCFSEINLPSFLYRVLHSALLKTGRLNSCKTADEDPPSCNRPQPATVGR